MAEYIEREAALEECDWYANEFCECEYAIMPLKGALENLPAADVRPVMRGKWVNYGDEYHPDIKCCMCGQRKPILLGNFNFNFCPNCGADMREES